MLYQSHVQEEAAALPPVAPLLTVAGLECYLPLHYNGTQLNGCVNIHGSMQPSCWVKNQGWQVRRVPLNCSKRYPGPL